MSLPQESSPSQPAAPGSEPPWLSSVELQAWQGLMHMSAQLNARLNRQLEEDQGISLADCEVLGRLRAAPQRRLRIGELGATLAWEQSRLSHHLARMEKRGLVTKERCAADRRGFDVVLTEVGSAAIEAAAPGHVHAVRALLFDHLDPAQVAQLAALTATVIQRLDASSRDVR